MTTQVGIQDRVKLQIMCANQQFSKLIYSNEPSIVANCHRAYKFQNLLVGPRPILDFTTNTN